MNNDFSTYRVELSEEDIDIISDAIKSTVESFSFNHIGYGGVLGGILEKEATRDVDIVMFTDSESKLGESLIESFRFYQELENHVKQHHPRYHLSIFPKKAKQELTNYINSVQRGSKALIPIHDLFFPDLKSMRENSPKSFCESVQDNAKSLHGKLSDIPRSQELSLQQQKPYFLLIDYAVLSILGRFPEKLVKAKIEGIFDYLNKYQDVTEPETSSLHRQEELFEAIKDVLIELDTKQYSE